MNFRFWVVELASLIFFLWGILEVRKKGASRVGEFLMIFFYALLLEKLDMKIFKSYHYSPHFFGMLGGVPICIALLWAVILAGSMSISDATGIDEPVRPFLDALLAVWMDLALDAIAIRIGYWKWVIPLNQGWFGVPAGNLYAWMWVAFLYSALARIVRALWTKDKRWSWGYLAIPPLAYAGLFLELNLLGWIGRVTGLVSQSGRLLIFAVQFLIFGIVVAANWKNRDSLPQKVAPVWRVSRLTIHLYFLAAFFVFGIFRTIPILGAVSLLILSGEIFFMNRAGLDGHTKS